MQNGKNTVLCVFGLKLGRFLPLVSMILTKMDNSVLSIFGCAGSLLLSRLFSSFNDGMGCHHSVALRRLVMAPPLAEQGLQGTDLCNYSGWAQ